MELKSKRNLDRVITELSVLMNHVQSIAEELTPVQFKNNINLFKGQLDQISCLVDCLYPSESKMSGSSFVNNRLEEIMKLLVEANDPVERAALLQELKPRIDGTIDAMVRHYNDLFECERQIEALEKALEWAKYAYRRDVGEGHDYLYQALEKFMNHEPELE